MLFEDEPRETCPSFEDDDGVIRKNDILYYLVDEDDNEIGFAFLLDGEVIEHYYDSYEEEPFDGGWGEELDVNGMYTLYEESDFL